MKKPKLKGLSFLLITCLSINCIAQSRQTFSELPLFENGKHGYACYRIPAIIKAPNGDLLAFSEGRINGCADFGNVDIVLKISDDNGLNWTKQEVVADFGELQAGNPAPVVDMLDPNFPDGRIFLFYNTGTNNEHEVRKGNGLREILFITSEDNGQTWSSPTNITHLVHRPNHPPKYSFPNDWRSYANTPGHAIQLKTGERKGRIFIPANHSEGDPSGNFDEYKAHAYYSDDHGKTWKLSPSIDIPSSNESIAVQLSNGKILQNIRQQNGKDKCRIIALSSDGGSSWDTTFLDKKLPDPVCQASIIDYTTPLGQQVLLFSNPNSQDSREKMTVRVSFDDGKSWLLSREIRSGESAYSDLVIQADQHIGLLYEHGNDGGIHYANFNWEWLINSKNHTDNRWVKKLVSNDLAKGHEFKLAPPMLEYEEMLFEDKTSVKAKLDYPGVTIHYTLNGENPTNQSPILTNSLTLSESAILKIKAYHDKCQSSDVISAKFLKVGKKLNVKHAEFKDQPHKNYPGNGAISLFDHQKGTSNFQEKKWSGFNGSNCEIKVELAEPIDINRISVSYLSDLGAWIFPPSGVEIHTSKNGQIYSKVYGSNFPAPEDKTEKKLDFLNLDIGSQKTKYFKIIIKNFGLLPEWHDGKGTPAWLFIDEILIF
jgi:sialidase-1